MRFQHEALGNLVTAIFAAAGCGPDEAACISDHLIEANLAGHDSHGVIRTSHYIEWLADEKVFPNKTIELLFENDVAALIDGQMGFGQSIGRQAMDLGLEKVQQHGLAAVALRNSAHLGRIGHWAEMAARTGVISLHFVNTTGLGMMVAPTGGIGRRLSANPVAVGIPIENRAPLVFDISTSTIAEGKIQVARNRGVPVPDGCIIDAQGNPTNDPHLFYADPPGALLPFGGHKGYGLGIVAELLAGALTGSGCSRPGVNRLEQGMLTILIDPQKILADDQFQTEIRRFTDFVKASPTATPGSEVLMPGEVEQRNRARRQAEGIELDETTWKQVVETAQGLQVAPDQIEAALLDP